MGSLGALRHLAMKLTHSPADADDLLQATCLRALESASRLRDHSNLSGWLARVMRNLQIDATRSMSRRSVPLTDRHVTACAPEGIAMWRRIDDDDVERLLPRLSPQLRTVWDLHHVDGLDQNEIADRLGIPRTTVATRMFRARLALRTALLQQLGQDDEAADAAGKARPALARPGRPRTRRPALKVHRGGKYGLADSPPPPPPPPGARLPRTAASAL